MITGSLLIRLPELDDGWMEQAPADRRALCALRQVPDGATVIIDIGDREYITEDAARCIQEHDHRLQIDIRGTDATAVLRFVLAARAGTWDVV